MKSVSFHKRIQQRCLAFAENIAQFLQDTPPAVILSLIIIGGSFIILLTVILFAYLSDTILDQERIFFDNAVMQIVLSFRSLWMTQFMTFVTNIGSYGVVGGSIIILCYLLLTNHKKESLLFIIIVLMGFGINTILKLIVARPRPEVSPLELLDGYSFPSWHSMSSFVFFATIAYFAYHFTKNKKISIIVAVVCFTLIFLIGISRIYLGVHYPSDVLGGYIAGALWYATIIVLDRVIVLYRLFKEYAKNAYKNQA